MNEQGQNQNHLEVLKAIKDIKSTISYIERTLSAMSEAKCNNVLPSEQTDHQIKNAVDNGCQITRGELSNINHDNYDIILDLTSNCLKYRKDPQGRSALKKADLKGVGPRRIEILKYLLEHPKRYISVDNISKLSGQCEIVEPNTLAKSINLVRKALGQKGSKGPCIITETSLGSAHHCYKICPQRRYLVIKEKQEITDKSHSGQC